MSTSETVLPRDSQTRPWGHFEVLTRGAGFLVKTLVVRAGCRLSLQRHAHRAEVWAVLQGTARVQLEDRLHTLEAGESITIARGQWHRLENHGPQPLVVLESQHGTRCSEDDIERAQDDFGRVP